MFYDVANHPKNSAGPTVAVKIQHLLSILLAVVFAAPSTWGALHEQDDDRKTNSTNLVSNSSMEKLANGSPVEWTKRTWSGEPTFAVETEFAHTGKVCLKIHSENGADASWSFPLQLKRNTDYRISAWVKTENLGAGGHGAQINLHELQFEGKTESIKGDNDWIELTSTFNSGPREKILLNLLFGGWGRATGTAWFDDVSVSEIKKETPPVPTMTDDQAKEFFATKIEPVLKEKCFKCHGGGKKLRAEFVMTNRDDLIAGGESGEAVDLESPLDSLLLSAINYEDYEMPPSGKLPKDDIDNITKWLQLGVPWKGEGTKPDAHLVEKEMAPAVNEETKKWWSFQKPVRPTPPESVSTDVKNLSSNIDKFIVDKLAKVDLQPNARANRQTLIRRAYYDLIGLPPSPEQVQAFVADKNPDAYEKLIDKLLASRHYGEKWGRHWLDLVRYAESNSYERDGTKPFVWRYRDYVIKSFNNDKPYDQFLKEQLAGDEIDAENADNLIATGYYRLGLWDDEPVDAEQAWFDDMDDILVTTTDAMLGLTVGCARCHDHKIDPIPQADYYKFLSFFRGVQRYGVRGHDTVLRQSTRLIGSADETQKYRDELERYKTSIRESESELREIEKIVKKDFIDVEHEEFKHQMNRIPLVEKRIDKEIDGTKFTKAQATKYKQTTRALRKLKKNPPKSLESALCVTEKGGNVPDTFVMIRGNAHAPGDLVEPGFPSVLSPPQAEVSAPADQSTSGRRMALANWIASADNPLTARVMVNRIWQHHFGRGIVRSSSDFGFQGTAPTHPGLLDWLSVEFVEGGWKIKRLHKMIMMSDAYCMSSAPQEEASKKDPLNDLFWRFDMRRLTAEEVRDSVLAANNTLNLDKMYGPSIYPKIAPEILHGQSRPGEGWGNSSPADITRRSIYIHIKRSLPVPMMAAFDVNDPDSSCAGRFNTVQPTQALAMLNSTFINEEAAKFADFAREQHPGNLEDQIKLVLSRATQRKPIAADVSRGKEFVESLRNEGKDESKSLQLFCVVALNLNEFLYLD